MRWSLPLLLLLACVPKDPEKRDIDEDGYVEADDCDDEDASVHPDATDAPYDGVDANCDGLSDNDVDLDGFDSADHGGDDCDDEDDAIHLDADERCDAVDRDCDGYPYNGAVDAPTWYRDNDGDGVGTSQTVRACSMPSGYAAASGDCNDAVTSVRPGAAAIACDGFDNDCDGSTDDEPGGVFIGATSYPSAGEAVFAAVEGDTVQLCEGLHNGEIILRDAITVAGIGAPALTTLRADSPAPVVTSSTVGATVRGLTLTNGQGHPVTSLIIQGGGVYVPSGSELTVENSVIRGNEASDGGGAWVGGTLTLVDTLVYGNSAELPYGRAGGIGVEGVLVMQRSTIRDNEANDAFCDGLRLASGEATLDATSVVENHDTEGVCLDGTSHLTGGIVQNNNDSGIKVNDSGTITDTLVRNNEGLYGGGVVSWGAARLEHVTIENNEGLVNGGAIAVIYPGASFRLENCTVRYNSSLVGANAVYLDGGSLVSVTTTWAPGSEIEVEGHAVVTKSGTLSFTCSSSGCN